VVCVNAFKKSREKMKEKLVYFGIIENLTKKNDNI